MHVRELVARLPNLAPKWSFLLLRNAEMDEPLSTAPNVKEQVMRQGANTPQSMWALPRLVDFEGVDLFHAPSNILPAGVPVPTVTTIHDIMWLTRPALCNAGFWGQIERRFYSHGLRRALRSSEAIIAVSNATRLDIERYHPAAAEKTTTILSGVSGSFRPAEIGQSGKADMDMLGLNYILVIGQNAPYKNHAGAIRAFAQVAVGHPDVQLVLVQRRGRRSRQLVQLIRSLNLSSRVHFVEPLDDENLVDLYAGAIALLHPSLYEGFGMPIAEAMACGCPVITSDVSAMPEVAGGAALLVNPEDAQSIAKALRDVLSDADLRNAMRKRGLDRAKQLCWDRCAEQHIEVYRRVIEIG